MSLFSACLLSLSKMTQNHTDYLAPEEAERKLMNQVDSLFDSQVSPATVRSSLQSAINAIHVDIQDLCFHLSTRIEQEQHHITSTIYELLNFHHERLV